MAKFLFVHGGWAWDRVIECLAPGITAYGANRQTWTELRRQLDRIAVGSFTGPAGTFRQRTEISQPRPPSSNSSASTRPRRSTGSSPPQPADQPEHPA
jgi:hypothetical protein